MKRVLIFSALLICATLCFTKKATGQTSSGTQIKESDAREKEDSLKWKADHYDAFRNKYEDLIYVEGDLNREIEKLKAQLKNGPIQNTGTVSAAEEPKLTFPVIDYRPCTDSTCKESLKAFLAKVILAGKIDPEDGDTMLVAYFDLMQDINLMDAQSLAATYSGLSLYSANMGKLGRKDSEQKGQRHMLGLVLAYLSKRMDFILTTPSEWKKYGTKKYVQNLFQLARDGKTQYILYTK